MRLCLYLAAAALATSCSDAGTEMTASNTAGAPKAESGAAEKAQPAPTPAEEPLNPPAPGTPGGLADDRTPWTNGPLQRRARRAPRTWSRPTSLFYRRGRTRTRGGCGRMKAARAASVPPLSRRASAGIVVTQRMSVPPARLRVPQARSTSRCPSRFMEEKSTGGNSASSAPCASAGRTMCPARASNSAAGESKGSRRRALPDV